MATTVISAMSQFLGAIQPTPTQTLESSTSHAAIRSYLKTELTVIGDFLTGSYARDTMIRQARDIDVFVVLDSAYYYGTVGSTGYKDQTFGPANLLDRIRGLLKKKYTNTQIGRDGQAVRVQFAHVHIDVVPAFVVPYSDGYFIPDSRANTWIMSAPRKHAEAVSQANARLEVGQRLVPMVKMIKYWNHANGWDLRGFLLEMWARDVFQFWSAHSFAEGLQTFFERAVYYLDAGYVVSDPAYGADLLSQFLPSIVKRTEARGRLELARTFAEIAIRANSLGDNELAISSWKSLMGSAFPAYG